MQFSFRQTLLGVGLALSALDGPDASAQDQAAPEKKSFLQHLIPSAISVPVTCTHFGGNSYSNRTFERYMQIYKPNGYLPGLQGKALLDSSLAYLSRSHQDEEYQYVNDQGNHRDFEWEIDESTVAREGKPKQSYYTATVYKNEHKKYNSFNIGFLMQHDITENDRYSVGMMNGVFSNSYHHLTALNAAAVTRKNLFGVQGMTGSAIAGVMHGYTKDEVGNFGHLGGKTSLAGGVELGWTCKQGLGASLNVTPAYVAASIKIDLDAMFGQNKHDVARENILKAQPPLTVPGRKGKN